VTPIPDAGVDAAPPPPARVPMFFAQGSLGRRTVSCDDGRTWIANHDEDPIEQCGQIDCSHHAWASIGQVVTDDYVLATYGWGHPGMVRRTDDGIHWEDVFPGQTFAGLAYGNGHIVANARPAYISTAGGAAGSWSAGGTFDTTVFNPRYIGFIPIGSGGRFVALLETGGDADIQLSDDNGLTWRSAPGRPTECARSAGGILTQNGVTIMAQADGSVCRSTDGGENWTYVPVTSQFLSAPLVVDGAFTAWNQWSRFQSTDGLTWSSKQGTTGVRPIPLARAASGTFVTVIGQYGEQQFYRSTDGLNWNALPATDFVASHPIWNIVFGWAKPSAECPLQ
jgi:hypothetical protein